MSRYEREAKRPVTQARAYMSDSCLHYNILYLKLIGIVLGSVLRENSRCLKREESYYEGAVKDLPHHILCGNSTFIKKKKKKIQH